MTSDHHEIYVENIPKPVRMVYARFRNHELAQIIASLYKLSPRLANTVAKKIVEMSSIRDVVQFLANRVFLLDAESQKILAKMLARIYFASYTVPPSGEEVFYTLLRVGVVAEPECIRRIVECERGVRRTVGNACIHVYRLYTRLKGGEMKCRQ